MTFLSAPRFCCKSVVNCRFSSYHQFVGIELLCDYLSTMGRCGAHFSLHMHETSHRFECRRASKALELLEPYIARGSHHEEVFYKSEAENIDGTVAWHFATYLIESINGGRYYGPDGVYMEVPERIGKMMSGGFFDETHSATEQFSASKSVDVYKRWLRQCLELRYDWSMAPDLYIGNLYTAGLENDPPIDYENY